MTITDIIGAAASVVGALGTPAAVLIAARALRLQRDQSSLDENQRRRLQPQRVIVRTQERDWPRVDGEGAYRTRVAAVVNASDEPVFDVQLLWYSRDEVTTFSSCRVALLPGERWDEPEPRALLHGDPGDEVYAAIWFYDSEERGWERGPRGGPRSVREAIAAP